MKTKRKLEPIIWILVVFWIAIPIRGQGTFIYDQQSSDESNIAGLAIIQTDQPGQSFTPNLNSVGFIRLALHDLNISNSLGATVYVNLRGDSITGAVLAASSPVFMPDNFFGVTNFFFASLVTVTPGVTYFFQPVVQSGDGWAVAAYNSYGYPGGMEFIGSTPFPGNDLWFREGIVPEPSSAVLFLTGIGAFACARRFRERRSVHESEPET